MLFESQAIVSEARFAARLNVFMRAGRRSAAGRSHLGIQRGASGADGGAGHFVAEALEALLGLGGALQLALPLLHFGAGGQHIDLAGGGDEFFEFFAFEGGPLNTEGDGVAEIILELFAFNGEPQFLKFFARHTCLPSVLGETLVCRSK
jgi:hypothetical protein